MGALQYVGRTPTSDSTIVAKAFADTTAAAAVVDTAYVNAQVAAQISGQALQTPGYVDTQDGTRAHKTDVDAADALYVPASQLSAANGVASLDGAGSLIAAQVPAGVPTDRVARSHTAAADGEVFLASGNTHTVTTTTLREFRLATIAVPDPGFAWIPLPFAVVSGRAGGTDPGARDVGNGNFGLFSVMPPSAVSNTVYGAGLGTAVFGHLNPYLVIPYAAAGATPLTRPPVTGALDLDLYACCWAGNNYVVSGTGLSFTVFVVPAM